MTTRTLTRQRNVWLFNAGAAFSGNPKWLFLYVNRFRQDIEAVWIADDPGVVAQVRRLGYRAIEFADTKAPSLQRRAGVFVVNQVKEHLPGAMQGIVLLNLWHGVGVKNIERRLAEGLLLERIATKYIKNNPIYRSSQLFLAPSSKMEDHFRQQVGFSDSQVIRAGYPQNLYLPKHGRVETFDHGLLRRSSGDTDPRIVVYAPTYRLDGNEDFLFRVLPDFDRLIETLEAENLTLIIKLHPFLTEHDRSAKLLAEQYSDSPRLIFWDNKLDIYEVFDRIDTAIIDYSSITYDLLAAGVRSFVRYVPDFKDDSALEAAAEYADLSCGTWVEDFDGLIEALRGDNVVPAGEVRRLEAYFWEYADDASLERIVDHALSYEIESPDLRTLYSYDVFDTVIHRRSVEPRSIFQLVKDRMRASSVQFPPYLAERFGEVRAQAESAVREQKRKRPELMATKKFEVTLDEIYARIGRLFGLLDEQLEALKAWEIEAEVGACVPNETVAGEIRAHIAAGERVVFISDMYLPLDVIKRMLAIADPAFADLPIYLSSEHRVQKSTGQLFFKVYLEERYDYAQWVHTGDNPHADGSVPRRLGIVTRPRPVISRSAFGNRLVASVPNYDGHVLAGILDRLCDGIDESDALTFVYRNIALYLVPYVEWVVRDAANRGYRTLYFVSRDGHHMKPVADAIIAALGLQIRTAYIYGSRRTWRLASQINGIDDDTFAPHGSFGGIRTTAGLLESARLDLPGLLAYLPEFATALKSGRFDGHTAGRIVERLSVSMQFRAHLKARAAEERDLALEYLGREINLDEKFAFVEYWGRGYTQDCLVRLLGFEKDHTLDVPFYYARSIYETSGPAIRHNYTSAGYSLLFIEAVFANLPYGTVTAYRRDESGEVVPVTADRTYAADLFAATEAGLPRFVDAYLAARFHDRDRAGRDAFRFGFEYFRQNAADPVHVRHLARLRDSVELGGEEREFAPVFSLKDFIDYMRGKPLSEITRSLPITRARSNGLGIRLLESQRRFGFRRHLKKVRRTLAERRAIRATAVEIVVSNPPVGEKSRGLESPQLDPSAVGGSFSDLQ